MSKLRELLGKATKRDLRKFPAMADVVVFDGPDGVENVIQENSEGYFAFPGEDEAEIYIYLRNNAEAIATLIEAAEEARKTFAMLTHTDTIRNTSAQTAWTHAVTNEARLRAALSAIEK
jgi:hypothetical protein